MRQLSIYLHVPFCVTKCAYCDFNSYAGLEFLVDDFVAAIKAEIENSPFKGASVPTLFFGGGTPTFLSGNQLADLLQTLQNHFEIQPDCEITSEANPGTVDEQKLSIMREAGFNRLSLGVQSFDDDELRRLDRIHKGRDAKEAVRAARNAGFDNLNLDFIFALPEQTREGWQRNLDQAFELSPEHLSLYGLIVEPNTPFYRMRRKGQLRLPSEDDELFMYEYAMEAAQKANYTRYEISNYARPGFECRHNLVYWRNEPYLGFGPGAVSYVDGTRWTNMKHPRRYNGLAKSGENLACDSETLPLESALGETIMLNLRVTEGVNLAHLETRFQLPVRQRYEKAIQEQTRKGLLESDGDVIRLTRQGTLLANDVCAEFLIV